MEEMEKMAKGYIIRRIHVIKAAKILKLGGVTGGVIRRSETAFGPCLLPCTRTQHARG